jgi:hypothetical protein
VSVCVGEGVWVCGSVGLWVCVCVCVCVYVCVWCSISRKAGCKVWGGRHGKNSGYGGYHQPPSERRGIASPQSSCVRLFVAAQGGRHYDRLTRLASMLRSYSLIRSGKRGPLSRCLAVRKDASALPLDHKCASSSIWKQWCCLHPLARRL